MAGLLFLLMSGGRPAAAAALDAMSSAAPHRGGPHAVEVDGPVAAAALGDGTSVAKDELGRLVVADTRLEEANELSSMLGLTESASPAQLILEAFKRWGDQCADHLRGDFSFVLWDRPQGRVHAARDVFGMRPLFHTEGSGTFVVASEIAQILAAPEFTRRVDERTALASLIGRARSPRWTHFEDIRRLMPAHSMTYESGSTAIRRYWEPIRRQPPRRAASEYAEELRDLLADSMRRRLGSEASLGLMLSGGIDSVSIAAAASRLRGQDPTVPELTTLSFAYEEQPESDERTISDRLTGEIGQTNIPIPATAAYPLADFATRHPDLDGPDLLQSHVLFDRALSLAADSGISMLMTGQRGDLLFGQGIRDYLGLLRHEGPREVWRQAGEQAHLEERRRRGVLRDELIEQMASAVWHPTRAPRLRRRARRMLGRTDGSPPWIKREAMIALGVQDEAPDAIPRSGLPGVARRQRHQAMLRPSFAASTEYLERRFARAGLRYGDPWSDRTTAEWVLSIPSHVANRGGSTKSILREAMRGVVPEYARDGRFQADPGSFYRAGIVDASKEAVFDLLGEPIAALRGYVDANVLCEKYALYRSGHWPGVPEWEAFWRFLALERWLRAHG